MESKITDKNFTQSIGILPTINALSERIDELFSKIQMKVSIYYSKPENIGTFMYLNLREICPENYSKSQDPSYPDDEICYLSNISINRLKAKLETWLDIYHYSVELVHKKPPINKGFLHPYYIISPFVRK